MTNFDLRRPTRRLATVLMAVTALSAAASLPAAADPGQVNVYSYREPKLTEPLFEAFTKATGIRINTLFAPNGLTERIATEGRSSPADVLLTNEFGLLIQARELGVTRPVQSPTLAASIPADVRDPAGHWFGLTRRARVIFASKDRVKQAAITYEELADPKWKGRICTRSGQHTYNVALVASMIATLGPDKAEVWLKGVKTNLARKPAGGDREQVRDVFAGLCDIAIGNTYYMGAMQTNTKNPEQKQWADSVRIIFPNTEDRGTHVNISGMAMAAYAPNQPGALKLMEFLASAEAQRIYADVNNEYPVAAGVEASAQVKSWGAFKPDSRPLADIAQLRKAASELIDKVNFDAGPNS
jgi:iron(III) transport system substrate-binding protein